MSTQNRHVAATASDEIADAVRTGNADVSLTWKDWLILSTALVGIFGFVGQYFVNTYRLNQIEHNHQELRDVVTHQQEVVNKIPGILDLLATRGQLLSEQSRAISDLATFRANQEAMNVEIRTHMKDTGIHMTTDRQIGMVQTAVQPLIVQLTRMEAQAEERQKQSDRMEKALEEIANKNAK